MKPSILKHTSTMPTFLKVQYSGTNSDRRYSDMSKVTYFLSSINFYYSDRFSISEVLPTSPHSYKILIFHGKVYK